MKRVGGASRRQERSMPLADAVRMTSRTMASTQGPDWPWPPLGTTTCRLFGQRRATSSAFAGGVTGSLPPESRSAGLSEATGAKYASGRRAEGQASQARR
ncbi:MAG: hypothetical protein AMXMBFR53_35430 [Gemmatimonadota bacterium]